MKKYETLAMKVIFFFEQDVITNSTSENVDDLGGWNNDWFTKGND